MTSRYPRAAYAVLGSRRHNLIIIKTSSVTFINPTPVWILEDLQNRARHMLPFCARTASHTKTAKLIKTAAFWFDFFLAPENITGKTTSALLLISAGRRWRWSARRGRQLSIRTLRQTGSVLVSHNCDSAALQKPARLKVLLDAGFKVLMG